MPMRNRMFDVKAEFTKTVELFVAEIIVFDRKITAIQALEELCRRCGIEPDHDQIENYRAMFAGRTRPVFPED